MQRFDSCRLSQPVRSLRVMSGLQKYVRLPLQLLADGAVWDSVHSGSGRTALPDNNTDYYPVPLSADTLRCRPADRRRRE
jgi:hypothetical protein